MNFQSNNFSPEIQNYFNTLPPFIQECIMQSGATFESEQELRDLANHLMAD